MTAVGAAVVVYLQVGKIAISVQLAVEVQAVVELWDVVKSQVAVGMDNVVDPALAPGVQGAFDNNMQVAVGVKMIDRKKLAAIDMQIAAGMEMVVDMHTPPAVQAAMDMPSAVGMEKIDGKMQAAMDTQVAVGMIAGLHFAPGM